MFRLTDHIERLFASAKIFMIDIPFTVQEIVEASVEFAKAGTDPKPEDALKNIYA